jgi:hypothetical protein
MKHTLTLLTALLLAPLPMPWEMELDGSPNQRIAFQLAWRTDAREATRKDPCAFTAVLASFAARAVRSGRRLVGMEKARDVLSPVTLQKHGFAVQSLPSSTRASYEQSGSTAGGRWSRNRSSSTQMRSRSQAQVGVPWSRTISRSVASAASERMATAAANEGAGSDKGSERLSRTSKSHIRRCHAPLSGISSGGHLTMQTTRKPTSRFGKSGVNRKRYAARQLGASSSQHPPRASR